MKKLLGICSALAIIVSGAGCASKHVSLESWRTSLEQYAVNHASGDLHFLRDDAGAASRPRFAVIGADSPDESTDIVGVLLGRRTIQGRDWLVFLVGTLKSQSIEDVRVALLADAPEPYRWEISQPDPAALQVYRQSKETAWRALHPNRNEPPRLAMTFPADEDVYRLEVAGNTISITEEHSRAKWTLVLGEMADDSPAQKQTTQVSR